MDEFLHEGEDVCVISSGCQNQLVVAESILHSFCHVAAGQIVHDDFGTTFFLQLFHQQLHGSLGVTVDGCVRNDDAFAFGAVAGPNII